MFRKILVALLVALSVGCAAPGNSTLAPMRIAGAQAQTTPAQYLVLISIDACRPEYLELAPLPRLQELRERGVTYSDAWVGSLLSNTPPGHTEMATGAFPNHNGILSFTWKNSETGALTDPTSLEAINNGEMARIVAQAGVPTLAGLIKAQTPDAKVAAVSAHKYYAAQGLGMGPTDYILYAKRVPKVAAKSKQPTPTPDRAYEPAEGSVVPVALKGHEPSPDVLNDKRLNVTYTKPGDENGFAINAALVLFEKYKPRGLLINLPETDGLGHKTGGILAPDQFRELMLATDAHIGRLIDAYRAAGIFDQTLWIITADHGMVPNSHVIDPKTLREIARQAGVQGGGGMNVYLPKPAQAPQLVEALAKKSVDGVLGLYAKVKRGDQWFYQPAPTTQANISPALNDAYLYLLGTYAGVTSHDAVVMLKENWVIGTDKPNTKGEHGSVTWGNQHIPLIISGPGIKPGAVSNAPARLVDLAPTIARGMNLAMTGMDGVSLADAFSAPQAADVNAQNAVTSKLAPLRDALKAASR